MTGSKPAAPRVCRAVTGAPGNDRSTGANGKILLTDTPRGYIISDMRIPRGGIRKGTNMDNKHNKMIENGCCCGTRHKKRTEEEQKALLTRLKRIEGQIRGLQKMVESDAYCPDILVQSSAATSALNSFNKVLLGCHIRSCVAEDIRAGKDETVDELCELLQRLMK